MLSIIKKYLLKIFNIFYTNIYLIYGILFFGIFCILGFFSVIDLMQRENSSSSLGSNSSIDAVEDLLMKLCEMFAILFSADFWDSTIVDPDESRVLTAPPKSPEVYDSKPKWLQHFLFYTFSLYSLLFVFNNLPYYAILQLFLDLETFKNFLLQVQFFLTYYFFFNTCLMLGFVIVDFLLSEQFLEYLKAFAIHLLKDHGKERKDAEFKRQLLQIIQEIEDLQKKVITQLDEEEKSKEEEEKKDDSDDSDDFDYTLFFYE